MFPQALVQNRIISKSNDNFELNWAAAAPILNANYFYIDQLINESQKYSKLLRFWTETKSGDTDLKIHEYYSANFNDDNYGIHIGDLVGRVRNTNPDNVLKDCLVLTRSIGYYIYDDTTQAFVPNNISGVPCVVRPSLWGLNEPKQVQLNNNTIRQIDGRYQYVCHSSDIKFKGKNGAEILLAYTTDAIMGHILYNDQLIAHVPVTIQRKWNAQLIDYEFALQFPDLNFPPSAKVEFW